MTLFCQSFILKKELEFDFIMVNCKKCNKALTDPKDVNVVALLGIIPKTLCNSCYALKERGFTRHLFYIPKYFPINSKPFLAIIILMLALWLLVTVLIFASVGEWTVEGEVVEEGPPIWIKFLIVFILFLIVAYVWILYIVARGIINKVEKGV